MFNKTMATLIQYRGNLVKVLGTYPSVCSGSQFIKLLPKINPLYFYQNASPSNAGSQSLFVTE